MNKFKNENEQLNQPLTNLSQIHRRHARAARETKEVIKKQWTKDDIDKQTNYYNTLLQFVKDEQNNNKRGGQIISLSHAHNPPPPPPTLYQLRANASMAPSPPCI